MPTNVPSQQDLYDLWKNEVQSRKPELTDFEEGAVNDAFAGAASVGGQELVKVFLDLFAKTYFSTANGPEITGGPDDLETLAVDHFGNAFARPAAEPAVGVVAFSRAGSSPTVLIPAGTIVKTAKDASGKEQRFLTVSSVNLVTTTISASVRAVEAGTEGNVNSDKVVKIESTLTDATIVVTNALAFSGGEAEDTDAEYREFIRNKIETLRGATKQAVEAAANNVPGIETATAIEDLQAVIEWNIATSLTVGSFFYIPRVRLFIADINGVASQALIDLVDAAVEGVRATGVRVNILAAAALSVNWTITISLNPAGPNFAAFSTNTATLELWMAQYIRDLPIGTGFNKSLAKIALMNVWGPVGTNDLTDITISVPTGNITATATQKLIPGTVEASP